MRKRFRVLLLAAAVVALIVPVGFALSLESEPVSRAHRAVLELSTTAAGSMPVLLSADDQSSSLSFPLPDAAKLLLVGTTLFGIAAVVRKSS